MAQLARRENIRRLEKICKDHGAKMEFIRESGSHVVFNIEHFGGASRFTIAKSSSDHRAGKNSEAMLRRILKYGPPPDAAGAFATTGEAHEPPTKHTPVSYTHLTLPTICSV